jgi:hypothetical protein
MMMRGTKMLKAVAERFGKRLADESAFSIAELLVASIILFVVTFAAINFAEVGTTVTKGSISSGEVNQELRETLEGMTRQIRVAYYFVPAQCSGTSLGFYSYATGDVANTKYNIRFRLNPSSPTVLQTSRDGGVSWTTLATGVTSLGFTYYDSEGNTTSDTTLIAMVTVSLRMTRSYDKAVGTQSEGHRMEYDTQSVSTDGEESVAIRNVLTTAP